MEEDPAWLGCPAGTLRQGKGDPGSARCRYTLPGAFTGSSEGRAKPSQRPRCLSPLRSLPSPSSIRIAMASAPRHMQGAGRAAWRITCSRELVVQNRVRLGDTQILIALSRRWLNPWWGLSGSSDHNTEGALLQSVLDRLQRGVLAPLPPRVGAGKGTRRICSICTQAIYPDEIENEVALNEGGLTVRLWTHTGCLAIWRRASEVYAQQQPSSADGHVE